MIFIGLYVVVLKLLNYELKKKKLRLYLLIFINNFNGKIKKIVFCYKIGINISF